MKLPDKDRLLANLYELHNGDLVFPGTEKAIQSIQKCLDPLGRKAGGTEPKIPEHVEAHPSLYEYPYITMPTDIKPAESIPDIYISPKNANLSIAFREFDELAQARADFKKEKQVCTSNL